MEPLVALPTRDLLALAAHWLADPHGRSHERARVCARIDAVRRSRRTLLQRLKLPSSSSAAASAMDAFSAAQLAADGLSCAVLRAADADITLLALVAAGIVLHAGDLPPLGVDSVRALLDAGATPAALQHAFQAAAPTLSDVFRNNFTPGQWLADAERLSARDMRALGVKLDAWLLADAALLAAARATAARWLARSTPEEWKKYAALSPATYARLTGAAAPTVAAGATPLASSKTWI